MVLVNHTISSIMGAYVGKLCTNLIVSDFIFNCCRMNVVTFIFISGALLLKKEESYRDWLLKRVLRIVLVILLFSAIYYPWQEGSFWGYLQSIYSSNMTNAFWYLYLYLGLMLLLPVLRAFVKSAGKKTYWVLFVLFGVTQGIYPLLTHYFGFPGMQGNFSALFPYGVGWIVLFLLGYYCATFVKIQYTTPKLLLLAAIWLIGNAIPTIITVHEFAVLQDTSLFMDNPMLLWSLAATLALIFLVDGLVQRAGERLHRVNKGVSYIAGLTFGIYLLGDKLIRTVPTIMLSANPVLNILVTDVVLFCIGGVITFVLKQIPYLKKLL